ncbi:MAG: cyclic nucleotide-binding domain-containing protein, partial [Bdellovibrionales bacterium]|nr:cyclic nucleotide-binding domain-containing protein [Bdellovibrionales bacterium]
MSGVRQLARGELLFREGDPSDACYVVKTGKIAIVKAKGSSEIELANIGPGQMFGEMAFFDAKPRSAGAKATVDATVVVLP